MNERRRGAATSGRTAIAIHGGAGTLRREDFGPGDEAAHHAALAASLRVAHDLLQNGGSAVDAVTAAVCSLEDCPLFNAGRGAVFTHDGRHELDAAVMDGATRSAGAVASVRTVRNPVRLARAVMEHTPYVLLAAEGAEAFARERGLAEVDQDYFSTEFRRAELERAREAMRDTDAPRPEEFRYGTVGAVALDRGGNLAAATSTGGLTNKRWGRIGDSPLIGAGTYADNRSCAVSATGDGEYFIRTVAAHEVASLMRHAGLGLGEAVERVVTGELAALGGGGGMVALDARGVPVLRHNTPGMYRGAIDYEGRAHTAIFAA